MAAIHQKLAVALVLAALGVTIWSLYRAYGGGATVRLVRASWVMVAAVSLQGAAGTFLGITGNRPADWTHFVFGPLTLLAMPVSLLIADRLKLRGAGFVVAAGWLLTFGLALRATGSGGLTA